MATYRDSFSVRTSGEVSLENITREVEARLSKCPVHTGIVTIHLPHTTTALAVNEDERGLRQDILSVVCGLLEPLGGRGFEHDRIDHNAKAHLMSVLTGNSLTLPFHQGSLELGTWESIFVIEMDGPRTRRVHMTAVGD